MTDKVSLPLSRSLMRVLHSAANEATGYYDDQRLSGGAPSLADADLLSDSIDQVMRDQHGPSYVWEVPRDLLPQIRSLIPACLAVFDDNELYVRTMRTRAEHEAAQAELVALLEDYTA